MATRDDIYTAIRNADAAGDAESVRKLAAYLQTMPSDAPTAPAAPRGSDAYEIGKQKPSLAVNAAGGPLFGFGDEIGGALAATVKGIPGLDRGAEGTTWKQRYEGYRDVLRGQSDQAQQDNPLTATGLRIAASLPTAAVGAGPAAVVKGTGLLANMGRAAITGGIQGTITGAGNSTANDLSGVAEDAATGGAISAALGGATVPVAAVLGAGARNVAQRVKPAAAEDYAKQKVAEALSRDARGNAFSSGAANPVDQAAARMNKLGEEATIADSAGKNTLGLLDTVATLPGQGKNLVETAIKARQAGRADRLIGAADEALGANGRGLATTVDAISQQRAQAAKPLYDQLHNVVIDAPSQGLVNAVNAADQLGATALGRKMATASQVPYTLDLANPSSWAMRDLDHVKQGLDTLIEGQIGNTGKLSPLGTKLQGLKQSLVSELDKATVDPKTGDSLYQAARQAYAGPSAMIAAAEAGKKAISGSQDSIRQTVAGMSPSELDAFRVGAFDALRVKMGTTEGGRTEMLSLWKNPEAQQKLKVLFGDERSYREFASTVAAEGRMKSLESVGRGSQTAARQYGAGDLDVAALGDATKAVGQAAQGNIASAIGGLSSVWNRVSTPEPVRNQIANLLLTKGQAGVNELHGMAGLADRINKQRAQNALAIGQGAGLLLR
jgi:hypothetical protein